MKKILVPIDFSNNSHNAYLFAREIAMAVNGTIYAIHVYPGTNKERGLLETIEDTFEGLEKRLKAFTKRFPENGSVLTKLMVQTEVVHGFSAVKKIAQNSENYDLIIMGTSREHPIKDKFLGSVASGVAQKANCPVLLVPQGAQFSGFKKMIYASNWESTNVKLLKEMISWASIFDARVDFAHISPEYEFKGFEKIREEIQGQLTEISTPDFKYIFSNVDDNSALHGIHQYANKTEADLIIIGNRQRRFLNNLFFSSLTKEMTLNIRIPVLVFHLLEEG